VGDEGGNRVAAKTSGRWSLMSIGGTPSGELSVDLPRSNGVRAASGILSPALDVEENDNEFTLHVEVSGVKPDDVEVPTKENVLTSAAHSAHS
jgi:Hsp20/alpha crystallin family